MATALSFPRRVPLLRSILNTYYVWRWSRIRAVCSSCAACGRELESDATRLLRDGHYRAAVFMARLQLETVIRDLGGEAIRTKCPVFKAHHLANAGVFPKRLKTPIANYYGRASRIVHGRVCSRGRAVNLVREIHGLIHEMLDSKSQQIVCRAAGPQDPTMEGGAA